MNKTGIEYLDFTSNPIVGCDMSLPCAERCWGRKMARRLRAAGARGYENVVDDSARWTGETTFVESELQALLHRRKPATVGLCFMADAFHESVPDAWLDKMLAVVALTPHVRYILPTKRARRMRKYFHDRWHDGVIAAMRSMGVDAAAIKYPLPNLILSVSVEDRKNLHRLDDLRETPAACRMLSAEPLLEYLGQINLEGIGWVIVGGESGPGARPMNPAWARSIRDQCVSAGVPFFFKQWGEWMPIFCGIHPSENDPKCRIHDGFTFPKREGEKIGQHMWRTGKRAAGRLLDGKVWDQYPEGWAA